MNDGLEIHHDGDLPARSGMGTSSSFTVGLLNALYALRDERPSKMDLAMAAIDIEQNRIGENVGSQDQATAAIGGFNRLDFSNDGAGDSIKATPVAIDPYRLAVFQSHLMLYFTSFQRMSSEIAGHQIKEMPNRESEMRELLGLVDQGQRVLEGGDIRDFGRLLDESWGIKRRLSPWITSHYIDYIMRTAKQAGAWGGKVLGAGGGGFVLLMAPPDAQNAVAHALQGLLNVPFEFESRGSVIIGYDGENK